MLQPSTKSRVQINVQWLEIERLRRNTGIIEAGRLWDDTVSNRSIDKDEDQTGEEVQWNLMLVTVTVTMIAVAAIDTFVSKNAMLSPA